MKFGGISVNKFAAGGFELSSENPGFLIASIWLGFTYFLFRYYQYFVIEGVDWLLEVFGREIHTRLIAKLNALAERKLPSTHVGYHYPRENILLSLWKEKFKLNVTFRDQNLKEQQLELSLTRTQVAQPIIIAIVNSCLRHSVVTDYLFPFILSGFILYYCGSADWKGSFLSYIFPI